MKRSTTSKFLASFRSLWREEDGQDLVEYSLLLGFIAVGSIATLHTAGTGVKSLWQTVSNDLSNAVTAAS
jgi:Flp pilus assembly pilin Flp